MSKKQPAERTAPRQRISLLRVLVVLVCAIGIGWGGYRAFADVIVGPPQPGPSTFAAYVDVTVTPTYSFGTPSGPAQSHVILAFIVANPASACEPLWGGAYTLDAAGEELEVDRRIEQLRSMGGSARVSFGGQLGTELAASCTDVTSLANAYLSVVERYELTSIDLDIEGASLADREATLRRAQAIKMVQDTVAESDGQLDVWVTLPVAPSGLTADGVAVVDDMLEAGVDLTGVNGMTMDFNSGVSASSPYSDVVLDAATALHGQVKSAFARHGVELDDARAWERVGITPMIGQNDILGEVFTIGDAERVNQFARDKGVGLVSMWSLNRDSTCVSPLPTVVTVVQTQCSGIDQESHSFADVLAHDLPYVLRRDSITPSPSPQARQSEPVITDLTDDPATSPYPIWEPLGAYPGGTKVVWHRNVYEARYWTSGFAPDTPVSHPADSPWTLVGPVLPGDRPAPLPTLPANTYPQWDEEQAYTAGTRVQVDLVPYEAKWWTQGQKPGTAIAGGSPWMLVIPEGSQ